MKKLLLLGAALAATSLFTACESTESSNVTSCEIKVLGVSYACTESSDAAVADVCSDVKEESMGFGEGTIGSGCPSGAVKTCTGTSDGITGTFFFYTSDASEATCEKLLADDEEDEEYYDDEDDYGFTPGDDEYYMKALKKAAKK